MPVTMYSAKDTIMDMTYKDPVSCRNWHIMSAQEMLILYYFLNWIPYLAGTYRETIESENNLHDLEIAWTEWKKIFDCCDKGLQYKIQQNWLKIYTKLIPKLQ